MNVQNLQEVKMNSKLAKKIRKTTNKNFGSWFGDFAKIVNDSKFRFRIKIAWKIIRGRL